MQESPAFPAKFEVFQPVLNAPNYAATAKLKSSFRYQR
jgi:hypothetical protein